MPRFVIFQGIDRFRFQVYFSNAQSPRPESYFEALDTTWVRPKGIPPMENSKINRGIGDNQWMWLRETQFG